jgi:hypothetical protein
MTVDRLELCNKHAASPCRVGVASHAQHSRSAPHSILGEIGIAPSEQQIRLGHRPKPDGEFAAEIRQRLARPLGAQAHQLESAEIASPISFAPTLRRSTEMITAL